MFPSSPSSQLLLQVRKMDETRNVSSPSCSLHMRLAHICSFFFFFFWRQRKRAPFHRFHLIFQAVTGERLFAIIAATSCRANWCVCFLQLGASSVAISVWTKRQSHHLIEDARVHLIYGMLNSTSAAHTHTHTGSRVGCSPGEEDNMTVAPFSSARC